MKNNRILSTLVSLTVLFFFFNMIQVKADWVTNGASVTVKQGAFVVINGDLKNFMNGATASDFDNSGLVMLTDSFVNNANFTSNADSYVSLTGDDQDVGGDSVTTFWNLVVEGNGDKTLSNSINITDSLLFNDSMTPANINKIILDVNDLTLFNNANVYGWGGIDGDNRFIVTNNTGSLVKNQTPSPFIFPIGNDESTFNPAILSNAGVVDDFSVRVEANVSPPGLIDVTACVKATWVVQEGIATGSNATLQLGWFAASPNTEDEDVNFSSAGAEVYQYINNTTWTISSGTIGTGTGAVYESDWINNPSGNINDFSVNNNRFIVMSEDIFANAGIDDTICKGECLLLTGTGTTTGSYEWSEGATTDTVTVCPTITTEYILTVTEGGSTAGDTVVVVVYDMPVALITGDDSICEGESSTLIGGTGNIEWSTGSTTSPLVVTPTEDSLFILTVSNWECTDIDSFTVVVSPLAPEPILIDTVICGYTDTVDVTLNITNTAGMGNVFEWYDASTGGSLLTTGAFYDASVTATTTFYVQNNAATCLENTSRTPVTITISTTPVAVITGDDSICDGSCTTLTVGGIGDVQWSTLDTTNTLTVCPTVTTTYTLTLNNSGCTDTDDFVVVVSSEAPAPILADITRCQYGDSVTVTFTITNTAGTGNVFEWYDASTGGILLTTGTSYTVTVGATTTFYVQNSATTCLENTSRTAVTINLVDPPVANFSADVTNIVQYKQVAFTDLTPGSISSWVWTFGDATDNSLIQDPLHVYSVTGKFTVTLVVTNGAGCKDTITKTDYITVSEKQNIFIPKAFTPNDDNKNDVLYVRGSIVGVMNFNVYNQWGFLVFTATNQADGWDGTYNGEKQPEGNYAYTITATTNDGDVEQQGIVTLIR